MKLSPRVAKLVIKDLISFDAAKKHLDIANNIIVKQEEQMSLYQRVIENMGQENGKLELIISEKEQQIVLKDEQIKAVEKNLKIQKRATTFYKITTVAALITAGILIVK